MTGVATGGGWRARARQDVLVVGGEAHVKNASNRAPQRAKGGAADGLPQLHDLLLRAREHAAAAGEGERVERPRPLRSGGGGVGR